MLGKGDIGRWAKSTDGAEPLELYCKEIEEMDVSFVGLPIASF